MAANIMNIKIVKEKCSKARAQRIQSAMLTASKTGDPIAVTYDKCSLRMSDVSLLEGPRSINEAIVSFYYCYLENERYKGSDTAFVAPDISNGLLELEAHEMEPTLKVFGLDKKSFIFFAFGDKDHNPGMNKSSLTHFTLVVYSRPEKTFFHYDSCVKMPSKVTQRFVKELSVNFNTQGNLKPIRGCTLLNTPYDCGIRILCMTDSIADYINRYECVGGIRNEVRLAQDTVSAKRSEMLKLLYSLGGEITV